MVEGDGSGVFNKASELDVSTTPIVQVDGEALQGTAVSEVADFDIVMQHEPSTPSESAGIEETDIEMVESGTFVQVEAVDPLPVSDCPRPGTTDACMETDPPLGTRSLPGDSEVGLFNIFTYSSSDVGVALFYCDVVNE